MDDFAIFAPRIASKTLPDAVSAALRAGAFEPAGMIQCPVGKIPRWRDEAKRGNLYISFETGAVYGCTSQTMQDLGHIFEILGYDTLLSLRGRFGKSTVTIRPGEPERLAGILLEALGQSHDPRSLKGGVNLSITTRETLRIVILALGNAHRAELGLDAIWRDIRQLGVRRPDDAMHHEAVLIETYQTAHRTMTEAAKALEAHFSPLVDAAIRDGDAVRAYHLAERCPTPWGKAAFLDRARAAGLQQPGYD